MKRKGNLYENMLKIENIEQAYREVTKNTRNERRVFEMKQYKTSYIAHVYEMLVNETYEVGKYNIFYVKEPKLRKIVSQGIIDKIINHLVARYILYPALIPSLEEINVASRINKGTSAGLKYEQEFLRKCNVKYKDYYILKGDIHHFFQSIDHDVLKEKLKNKIKDKRALKMVFDIIDSNIEGLYIGAMTNQALAIFYLDAMDKFIKEELKIKYYIRYQDDFLLFHPNKDYLRYCLKEIEEFLKKEKLTLNPKTRIYKNTNNFTFLGRNPKNRYVRYRNTKRKLKAKKYMYETSQIDLYSLCCSYNCYETLLNKQSIKI